MDWLKKDEFKGLTFQQLQVKVDELNREKRTLPVSNCEIDPASVYDTEVWVHFRSGVQVIIIYRNIE